MSNNKVKAKRWRQINKDRKKICKKTPFIVDTEYKTETTTIVHGNFRTTSTYYKPVSQTHTNRAYYDGFIRGYNLGYKDGSENIP